MFGEEAHQAWVTLAVSDVEAVQALILAKSLTQALTKRKMFALVTENVSVEMKYVLLQAFQGVITITKSELNMMGFSDTDLTTVAKLWCWTLQQFKKCVFLSPSYLITENCDELFTYDEVSTEGKRGTEFDFDPTLFVVRPSFKTFENLLKLAGTYDNDNADQALNKYFKNWNSLSLEAPLSLANKFGNLSSKLARFESFPWADNNAAQAQSKVQRFLQIYFQHVLPLLISQEVGSVQKFVNKFMETNKFPLESSATAHSVAFEENLEAYKGTIAVVGMSCRFPGANSPAEYWKLLSEGREAIRKFPSDRSCLGRAEAWELEAGFLNCAIDMFDNKFFGISPREALLMDPQQRLLLEVVWESLEDAGINPQSLKNTDTGVYVGMWQQDYERIILSDSKRVSEANDASHFLHTFLGNKYSATASRISFCLGLNGPALAVESGCSSSLNGVHLACESLHNGETSLALASGVNMILLPLNPFSGRNDDNQESVVLSKDFRCKTFDESANGFVRAEGCGVVVLKRFEDAIRDGDKILSIIRGTAVNNDGAGTSFGTPNEKAQEKVYRAAMKRANVAAAEVSFIETHGTGTVVGDPIEMYAVGQAYSENRTEPLFVGSVKTNIGHCEAAAGIASLIKVILCIQNEAIPPHLNLKTLNPRIDLDRIPAVIPMKLTDWTATPKIAAVSSFSMSATNAHVIVQEPPKREAIASSNNYSMHMVTISAKSEEALKVQIENYTAFFKANSSLDLADIAYSANTCRASLPHRAAIMATTTGQLIPKLEKRNYILGKANTVKSKIGFLFTGQGSQYIEMANGLQDAFPVFRKAVEVCESLFQSSLNESFKNVIWNDNGLLNQTLYCQPAIFCIQYCLLQLWDSFGIRPDYVLGHSIGEFAAAVCAGILTLENAMKLVVARSKLVNELAAGSMLAVRTPVETVKGLIKAFTGSRQDTWIDIAAVNSPEEVVVSGQTDHVKQFEELCTNNAIKSVSIPATHAFHSREMDNVLQEFGKTAETVVIGNPNCIYVSGTLAKVMEPIEFGGQYWQRHLRDTVRFSEAINVVWADCKTLVEIGAQPILLGLAMANVDNTNNVGVFCPSIRRKQDPATSFYEALSKLYVNGCDLDWSTIYGRRQKTVNLPHYPFQRQKYWFVDEEAAEDEQTPIVHPLLGREFLSPLADLVFCQTFRLRELTYMEDHKVAGYVVVPMAGLLETFMAASREVLQGGAQNKFPITIETLAIEAALPLESRCRIQTVISSEASQSQDDTVKYKLTLNRKLETHYDKWKRHAQAVFTPSSKLPDKNVLNLEELKSTLTHKESLESSYQTIAEVGIQFGPKFQSISSAWYGSEHLLTEIHVPDDSAEYICHPIVLDAMIQTYAFREYLLQSKEKETNEKEAKKQLFLPISINKFTWLSKTPSKTVFAHSAGKTGNVTLYNETGEQLAVMEGLELLQTTTQSVIRAIRADMVEVPAFMCDRWRPAIGKTTSRVNMEKLRLASVTCEGIIKGMEGVEEWREDFVRLTDKFNFLAMMNAVHECSWPWPQEGGILTIEDWQKLLPSAVAPQVVQLYFQELEVRKYLAPLDETRQHFKVLKKLMTVEECENATTETRRETLQMPFDTQVEVNFGEYYAKNLNHVLMGRMTPLAFLFPDDESAFASKYYYTHSHVYNHQNVLIRAVFTDMVKDLAETSSRDGILRILEVGAGTGTTAQNCIQTLNEMKIPFHYTFTDISPLFLSEAKTRLGLGSEITYQTLNIEQDPLSQGFVPEEFDIVIASQVIHATPDIIDSLRNVKKVLRVGGQLILGEAFRAHIAHTFVWGMLDGWWKYTDFRVGSRETAIANEEQWTHCLANLGFDSIVSTPGIMLGLIAGRNTSAYVGAQGSEVTEKKWIVFTDSSSLSSALIQNIRAHDRDVQVLNTSNPDTSDATYIDPSNEPEFCNLFKNRDTQIEGILYMCTEFGNDNVVEIQRQISTTLLHLLKGYEKNADKIKVRPKFAAVTRGVYNIGDAEPGNPNGATVWGVMKVFLNEYPNMQISLMDLEQGESNFETQQVFAQLWSQDNDSFVAYRQDKKFVMRLAYIDKPPETVNIPQTDRYKFINPPSGAFSDIEVGPSSKKDLAEENVEIEVRATALNFRDLFMVLKPDGFELPDDNAMVTLESVGLDMSGVVVSTGSKVTRFQVGDEVFGFTTHGALGSHTMASEKMLMKIPNNMTFEEACTIPCAFITAHLALIEVAKITKEDRVLIHVATGGVGLASIQVVRSVGSEIYATAGSKRKRAYLRAMGIKHVYHSRNTSYGEEIMRDTNGAGVTVVLNSLTGPNFKETSLDVCAPGARFIEIAKINIWKVEEVTALRPDVIYTIVDLSTKEGIKSVGGESEADTEENFAKIEHLVANGTYLGLPSVSFPLTQIRDAFYYFQKALHIGKIVVRMPRAKVSGIGKFIHANWIFNDRSTYLITGGLGGLGVEVTKWMLTVGAKTIVLVGRALPKLPVQKLINEWNAAGSTIIVIQADVGELESCKLILEQIKDMGLPPLRGIMHAAGVLADNLLTNQTAEDFEYVLRPKVHGGWYLHQLTIGYQLEFFVMFSSLSGILGMPGQYNHGSANRFLDSLTHYRAAMGLPGTTINWGGWSDVGAAAHIAATAEVFSGMRAFTPAQGISALDSIMSSRDIQVGVSEVADWGLVKEIFRQGKYLDEMKSHKMEDSKFDRYDHLIEDIKAATNSEERQERIQTYIAAILKQTLNLPQTEVLDIDQDFSEFGVDSLMAMELKNRLHDVLGEKTLSISSLQENRTIRSLSTYLTHVLETESPVVRPLADVIKEDVVLPEGITAAEVPAAKPSEFKLVLITGATGHLGIYCLVEALAANQNLTVNCLVRGESDEHARVKLENALKRYKITIENMDRVTVFAGNVINDKFGLSDEIYERLTTDVDAVIHCAAKTSHIGNYQEGTKHDLRTHNVVGLINVLKFTCSSKNKPLLHASTLLAANKVNEDRLLAEEYPEPEDHGELIKWGYPLSKFVAEKLLQQAQERGATITTIRFPGLFGSTETGYMPPGYNHLWSTILASMRVRLVPEINDHKGVPIMAVNSAAKVAMDIFLNDQSETGVYNFTCNSFASEELIQEGLNEHGISCEFVPFKEWREAVFEEAGGNLLGPVASLYADEEGEAKLYSLHSFSKETETIDVTDFSPKVKRNYPEVANVVPDAGTVIRRHLKAHFEEAAAAATV